MSVSNYCEEGMATLHAARLARGPKFRAPLPEAYCTQTCHDMMCVPAGSWWRPAGMSTSSCLHEKVRDGDWSRETAVLAECSPACWTEVRAAQLDWHRSHAPQDLYAQASAEAFASSRQALQAFARLSGKAAQGSEAAALSLIREPGILATSDPGGNPHLPGLHSIISRPAGSAGRRPRAAPQPAVP